MALAATPPPRSPSGRSRVDLSRQRLLLAAPAVAIAGTLLAHAGFSQRGQVAFIVLAAAAVLALAALDPDSLRRGSRTPIFLTFLALAALTALSAAWTIGGAGDALRWGAVVAGYGGMALSGYAVTRRGGPEQAALLLAGLAAATAVVGLIAAGIQEQPFAERIGGAWRPGGPFEYPPALGALQLAALPLACRWMAAEGRRPAAGSGIAVLAAAVVALVSSRAILALAVLILIAIAVQPRRTVGVQRPLALAMIGFVVTAAMAADAVAGSYAEPYVSTPDLPRLLGLSLLVPAGVALWVALRRCFDRAGRLRAGMGGTALAFVLVPLAAACTGAALTPDTGTGVEPDSGITHGRVEIWGDAVETAIDNPFAGTGALTFLEASSEFQDQPAARFAHNLVLEQWVELGYPGLVGSLALLVIALGLVVRSRGTPAAWLLGTGAITYMVAMLIDWPWHVPASGAVFAFVLGGLSAGSSIRRPFDRAMRIRKPCRQHRAQHNDHQVAKEQGQQL